MQRILAIIAPAERKILGIEVVKVLPIIAPFER
jgi:hypothetical protein